MSHAECWELLAIYRDLGDAERALVDAHLGECPDCAARLLACRRMDRDLAALPDPRPSERLDARFTAAVAARRRPWAALLCWAERAGDALGWAAVAVVAALLVAGLALAGRPLIEQAWPAAQPTAAREPTATPRLAARATPISEPTIPPPTVTPTPEPTVTPRPRRTIGPTIVPGAGVTYEGITFDFGPAIAASVRPEWVPAGRGVVGERFPEHVLLAFRGYALSDTWSEPSIVVYPVAEYAAVSEYAGNMVESLRQFLSDRPAAPRSVPFLPYMNAGQAMCAKIAYLDFENGHGVRFLTEYHQACVPVNNQDLFYTFQGLTDDGAWYISAILPVAHPSLPADASIIYGSEWPGCTGYEEYLRGIVAQLEPEPAASFAPPLDLLDEMIRSLRVQ